MGEVREPRLRGLLTLASLVSERVYLSDVHLGDNKHFARSYSGDLPGGLYTQFEGLVKQGVVRLLLRDASVRPDRDESFPVNSFFDVYRSWQKQDVPAGWIVPPGDEEIIRFLKNLDKWVPEDAIERYRYLDQKELFIKEVRTLGSSPRTALWLGFDNNEESLHLRAAYDSILNKEWFSLTDFNILFHDVGLKSTSRPIAFHGLLNERAYSRSAGSALVGTDLRTMPLEDMFWPEEQKTSSDGLKRSVTPLEAILERARVTLDAPSLSVIADLSVDEVLELRGSAGTPYFDLMRKAADADYLANQKNLNDFEAQLAWRAGEYWQGVADYLARHHSGASYRVGKLAIVAGGRLPTNLGAIGKVLSFAVNVGLPAATGPQSLPVVQLAQGLAKACLRFLFYEKTPEWRSVRRVIPNRTWLTKSNAIVLPEQSADDWEM